MSQNMDKKIDTSEIIEEFEMLTKNAERIQKEILKKILGENGDTEYLNKWGLNGRSDPESFKSVVPIATHMDFEPYICRIMDGDTSSILTKKAPSVILISSGTTQGKPKFVPLCDKLIENLVQMTLISFAFRNRKFPIGEGKALQFFCINKQLEKRGDLQVGTGSTHFSYHPSFVSTIKAIQAQSCSPREVMLSPDYQDSLYCHLLCGLIQRDEIEIVMSPFAHQIVQAFRLLEQVWKELCSDIRIGVLSSTRITIPFMRKAMMEVLKPNPKLADEIYEICSRLCDNHWYNLISELFPKTKYIYGVMTGSMIQYVTKLRHYAGDNIPLVSSDYSASEICVGTNVNPQLPPELTTYVILPTCGYFEFIPRMANSENDKMNENSTLGLSEVKVGEEYEVVITNHGGLYRYRLGDVVKITGFYNSAPQIQFLCRSNLILNINIEKHTEKDLQIAVEASSKILAREKIDIVDFTSYADMSTNPGHYVIFVELSREAKDELSKECCDCLDRSFPDASYAGTRRMKGIGALELRVVRRGTFQKILEHYMELGATATQIKMPRCVGHANKAVLQILENNVAKSYFSTAF